MTSIVTLLSKPEIRDLTYDQRIEFWGLEQFLVMCKRNHFRIFIDILKTQNKSETLFELQYREVRLAHVVDLIAREKAWHVWL